MHYFICIYMSETYDIERGKTLLLNRWEICTPEEMKQGRDWYLKAHDYCVVLSMRYEVKLYKVVGVMASLSPRNKWADNKKDTVNVLVAFKEGNPVSQVKLSSPHPKIDKCVKILEQGVHPEKLLIQKSLSFYRCILNPMVDDVCVDTWSARAVDFYEKWIPRDVYPLIQESHRLAAKEVGVLPHVLQATTWCSIRRAAA